MPGPVWTGPHRPWEPTGHTTTTWANIPTRAVPLDGLHLTQNQVSVPGLIHHAHGGPSWCGDPHPHVIHWQGRYWVNDGHHRALVAWLRGDQYLEARVLGR